MSRWVVWIEGREPEASTTDHLKNRSMPPPSAKPDLLDKENLFRLLAAGVKDYGILMLDTGGRVLTWNDGAQGILGYRADEVVGQHFSIFSTPEAILAGHPATELRLATEQGRYNEDGWRVRSDGSRFLASVSITAIRDHTGQLLGFGKVTRDISKRKQAEELLRLSQENLRLLISGVQDYAIVMLDAEGRVTAWNEGAQRITGYRADEVIGKHLSIFFTPEAIAADHPAKELQIASEHGRYEEEGWRVRKDGSRFFANTLTTALRDPAGRLRGYGKVTRDITERHQAQNALFLEKERAQVTLNSIGDAVISTDISGTVVFLNAVAETMTGWTLQDAAGRPITEVFHVLDATTREVNPDPMMMAVAQNRIMNLPANAALRRRDGSEVPIEDSLSPIRDRDGQVTGGVIVFRDVSIAREMTLQMAHLAQHDFLTGLPNRMFIEDRIAQAITLAGRSAGNAAVIFLDLDGFKRINDSLGHATGDKLLRSVTGRLLSCVRGSDTVSRQGGDEFIVLLSEVANTEDPAICARRILAAMSVPHSIDGHDLHITASVGVSVFPDDGLDTESLIRHADIAMYQAKANGRNGFQFFEPTMNVRVGERHALEADLRHAVDRHELELHYQPTVSLQTGEVTGAEALLRWNHPVRGLIPPAQFIPVAEDSGLIVPIGRWVLREACAQSRAWCNAGLPPVPMAVNVSALEFRSKQFLQDIMDVLEETGLNAKCLELELTETVLMKNAGATEAILNHLRECGVRLAVDDFGTGYSSLSYLTRFPITTLKIDQSFTRQIASGQTAIVTAIIAMGRSLGLRIVAEGVETEKELQFLQDHKCDEAQGYYFSKPVRPREFVLLLKAGSTKAASTRPNRGTAVSSSRGLKSGDEP
jgi:diguanylate cyclase (GGDEF)-like protein/PAS domain S-box-containing protein